MLPIERFWCCLFPGDQFVLAGSLAFFVTLTGYIPKIAFDGLWATYETDTAFWRRELFLYEYQLTLGEVDLGDGEIIEVYFFDLVFWPMLALYAVEVGLNCAEPCRMLTYTA